MSLTTILSAIPDSLRHPLLTEYNKIIQHYLERRWTSSELSGGLFSEIVYTILEGHANGTYAAIPNKPQDMVAACKSLEKINHPHIPRGLRILIPRMLPVLYEIRNNRSVGHVGGDVDSNEMDAHAVVSMTSWIMGELIRVFHNISIEEAQSVVQKITERRLPLIWENRDVKRVLDNEMTLKDRTLLLISSSTLPTQVNELFKWAEQGTLSNFIRLLKALHSARMVELSEDKSVVELLPPGLLHVENILEKYKTSVTIKSKKMISKKNASRKRK